MTFHEILEKFAVNLLRENLEGPSKIVLPENTFMRVFYEEAEKWRGLPPKLPEELTLYTSAGPIILTKEIRK